MNERLYVRLDGDAPYAPETSVPAGTMRDYAATGAVRALVAHVTAYDEVLPSDEPTFERVLPDGAARLIVEVGSGSAGLRVVGPSAAPVLLTLRGHLRGVSVQLRPGAALALFGRPAHELTDESVPWAELTSGRARELESRLQRADTESARVDLVLGALGEAQRDARPRESLVAVQAAALLGSAGGSRTVRDVAAEIGLSERRLQQVFRAQMGLAPRTWARLARMHACLRMLRRPVAPRWDALAVDGGFYDQAHLINEFRDLCGLTPEQFLRRRVSGSSNTTR